MELIQKDRQIFNNSRYSDYIFCNDSGTLFRSGYNERDTVPVESKVVGIQVLNDSIIILKYDNELEFKEIHTDSLKKRTLIKSRELEPLFKDKKNAYENCVTSFEYHEGKLLCVFKENAERFLVAINLVTSEMETIGKWCF